MDSVKILELPDKPVRLPQSPECRSSLNYFLLVCTFRTHCDGDSCRGNGRSSDHLPQQGLEDRRFHIGRSSLLCGIYDTRVRITMVRLQVGGSLTVRSEQIRQFPNLHE